MSPSLTSASAQTFLTSTENYLLSRLHRELSRNSMHTFHILGQFCWWIFIGIIAGCVTCHSGREKSESLHGSLPKITSNITIFLHRKQKVMSLQGEMNAEFSRCRQQSICNGRLYTLLVNVYPGAFTLYTQTHIWLFSIPTHKCICSQIRVKIGVDLKEFLYIYIYIYGFLDMLVCKEIRLLIELLKKLWTKKKNPTGDLMPFQT